MSKRRSNTGSRPDLLPWQAVMMVACVTAAGLLHEHPGAMRPLLSSHQTAQMRSSRTAPPATALNAALRPAQ